MTNRLTDIPTTEPESFAAGDTVKWKRTDLGADYAPASYTLTYVFVGIDGRPKSVTATEDGSDYLVTIPAATTKSWTAGAYKWAAYISDGTQRAEVDSGTLTVKPNLAAPGANFDPRSHAAKMLASIETAMESFATQTVQSVTLADGRSVTYSNRADLIKLRQQYLAEVKAEEAAEKINNGQGSPRRLLARM